MGFGRFIRDKREEAGLPLRELANRIGISPAYWSRIERDMEKPPKDVLIVKAATVLGLDVDDLFIQAERLPPDMKHDMAGVVGAYRKRKPET